MSKGVGDVKGRSIWTKIKVPRIGTLQFRNSRGNGRDSGKERTWVNAKSMDCILKAVGHVQSGARSIENSLFAVETRFEITNRCVQTRIKNGGEISILIENDQIGAWINRSI